MWKWCVQVPMKRQSNTGHQWRQFLREKCPQPVWHSQSEVEKRKRKRKKNWWQWNHEDFKKNNACLKGNSLQHAHRITDSGAVFLLGVRHQLGYTRSSRYIELAGPSLLMLPRPPLSSHLPALLRPLLKTSYSTMAPGRNNRVFVIGVGMTKVLLSCICIVIVHRRRERPNTWI